MVVELPESIKQQCHNFVVNYNEEEVSFPNKFVHNKTWKENNEELEKITTDNLNVV